MSNKTIKLKFIYLALITISVFLESCQLQDVWGNVDAASYITKEPLLSTTVGTAEGESVVSLESTPTPSMTSLSTSVVSAATSTIELTNAPTIKVLTSPTATLTATPTLTPMIIIEPTATYWPTVTRQILSETESLGLSACVNRFVSDDLLTIVTQQFTLPANYIPTDLVSLTDYFDSSFTLGQSLYVRSIILESLQQMIAEMHAVGLQPSVISAYRSYQEQALAWQWWNNQYPDRVAIMSAQPGASEHQLGSTIDFGSPELNHLFHVDFAKTSEGMWLAENANKFGFTLSYPSDSYEITGFKYEPWHYRYVGKSLSEFLHETDQILTTWQLNTLPIPCIP